MKILVTGASGLIGTTLLPTLDRAGHTVVRLVRSTPKNSEEVQWDPDGGTLDEPALRNAGIEGVVHLAGENVASGRWTSERKRRIRDSRVEGTRLLSSALSRLSRRPTVLVSASAIGYYGDRGDELVNEESGPGDGFLADVCREWEAATAPAADAGIRVVHTRFGVVLSARGGSLSKMLPPFRMGVGGHFGSGLQWMSWIAIDDLVDAVTCALQEDRLRGPVNLVAPHAVRNREFGHILGRVLHRPAVMAVPGAVLRIMLGELAEAVLTGQHVEPARLRDVGFNFRYPELEGALRHLLGT